MRILPAGLAALAFLSGSAQAQVAYSIDYQGPTIGRTDPISGAKITEADVLGPALGGPAFGTLGAPTITLSGAAFDLGLFSNCVGHQAGDACGIELNALSRGQDALFDATGTSVPMPGGMQARRLWFSVDEYAGGSGVPIPGHATVMSEAPVGDASADVFCDTGLPAGPVPPPPVGPAGHNAGTIDGNGLTSTSGNAYFGLGLIEPNPPTFQQSANPGDNLDALDIGLAPGFPATGVYFSLDAAFPDPRSGLVSSATAAIEGVSGADVLFVGSAGGNKGVYASANVLGLDSAGVDSDDIDALILGENGLPGYQPSSALYDWLPGLQGSPSDMLMFSVRRGSAVIGTIDSLQGLAIEPGDVLVPPGAGMTAPGIFIAAESLGLATVRSGQAQQFGDDMDAMSATNSPCFDCNSNGVEDSVDIGTGQSMDVNGNGIPDECEQTSSIGCNCPSGSDPCGNPDAGAGCANSTGSGSLLSPTGTTSVFADDLSLTASNLPSAVFGILYMGSNAASAPFGDGLRCAGGTTWRYAPQFSRGVQSITYGPGVASLSCASFPPAGCISAGQTWIFQAWYRDPTGPCGAGFNFSNGLSVTFTP